MAQTGDGPAPRCHPLWGRATTFAGRGTSVSCLATYYPRYSLLNFLQIEKNFCLLLAKMEIKLSPGWPNWPGGSREARPGMPGPCWRSEPRVYWGIVYVYWTRRSPLTTRPIT